MPAFNGTPEETLEWLSSRRNDATLGNHIVVVGRTMRQVSIEKYLVNDY